MMQMLTRLKRKRLLKEQDEVLGFLSFFSGVVSWVFHAAVSR